MTEFEATERVQHAREAVGRADTALAAAEAALRGAERIVETVDDARRRPSFRVAAVLMTLGLVVVFAFVFGGE